MTSWPVLSLVTFLPIIGALFVLVVRGEDRVAVQNMRFTALFTTLITFLVSLSLWVGFDRSQAGFQFLELHSWLGDFATYRLGVDGISMPFVLLTTFLMPICILASWKITYRVKEYMIAFLVLETMMVGVFVSLDLFLFYLFFEGGLIPMFLIIGVWGGAGRVYASFKFFLYTLLGSVLMLLAMFAMYFQAGTSDITVLLQNAAFPANMQIWLWLAFFASFAVKMPMWPVHTWLPDAHVEAPTAGSVILAAILLKMGGYGFIRFSLPMFPDASVYFTPLVFTLSIVAIIYTSLVALAQQDMKKLIAYSSVAHMGFVTMGIFSMTRQGIDGAMFQMISHGLVSGALFLCVGVVYDRLHTREISAYGGLVYRMPFYAMAFMLFTMANVGLPGTSGFVGEFLALAGTLKVNTTAAILATTGIILSAGYALWLYRRVVFGTLARPQLAHMPDLSAREIAALLPLVYLTIHFGVYPTVVLDIFSASVESLLTGLQSARLAVEPGGLAALIDGVRP
jgi:NADH-quinone oxidoreductase subunit M